MPSFLHTDLSSAFPKFDLIRKKQTNKTTKPTKMRIKKVWPTKSPHLWVLPELMPHLRTSSSEALCPASLKCSLQSGINNSTSGLT